MGDSGIEWTNFTVNFWKGCTKITAGCRFCYMFRDSKFRKFIPDEVHRTSQATFYSALKKYDPKLIFTCSWSDFFHEDVPKLWRDEAWQVIQATPHHIWQVLTKRPENFAGNFPENWGAGWENVWLGVTVEKNTTRIMDRIKMLQDQEAITKFISAEPLIGDLKLKPEDLHGIDWVIVGGESGFKDSKEHSYRKCDPEWIRDIVSLCKEMKVPVHVKQLGTYIAEQENIKDWKGGKHEKWPEKFEDLKIREWPYMLKGDAPPKASLAPGVDISP